MDAPYRTLEELHAEIGNLRSLLQEAECCENDPEAEIAAGLFRHLLERRERELAAMLS